MANLVSSLFGQLDLVTPSTIAVSACQAIAAQVDTQSWSPVLPSSDYTTGKSHYWSSANADLTPACVVFPETVQDVSDVVATLLDYPTVPFAVKSGGHNANVGFSSVNGGVLISFSKMANTTLSADEQTADIQPGARWENVISALEPYDLAVVGGRVGDVGVGGLLIGCGLSFLSAQYGLPCDSIVKYEVVLSNATIVDASATSNPDLFWALKGGGNQFGIITKFTMTTIPIGQVWGGVRTYSATPLISSQILQATQDFTENYPDIRAGIIISVEILADDLSSFWTLFFFYNGPELPNGVFDKFNAIPSTSDTTMTQSYSSLLTSNNDLASIYGLRYVLRGVTIPNLPGAAGIDLVNANYNSFVSQVTTSRGIAGLLQLDIILDLVYQPFPHSIANASATRNPAGNLLGLSANSGDHMWMAVSISWLTALGDDTVHSLATTLVDNIKQLTQTQYAGIKNSNYQGGDLLEEEYSPAVFMNDAMSDQQVLQGYGNATYQRLKAIQKEYDPIGFFPGRTGGFKYT